MSQEGRLSVNGCCGHSVWKVTLLWSHWLRCEHQKYWIYHEWVLLLLLSSLSLHHPSLCHYQIHIFNFLYYTVIIKNCNKPWQQLQGHNNLFIGIMGFTSLDPNSRITMPSLFDMSSRGCTIKSTFWPKIWNVDLSRWTMNSRECTIKSTLILHEWIMSLLLWRWLYQILMSWFTILK